MRSRGGVEGAGKVKRLDDLIEEGFLELECFRRGEPGDAEHHVLVDDVDRHPVPLGPIQNARKGSADCLLAIALKGLLGNRLYSW